MRLPSRPHHWIWIGLTVGVFGLGLLATIAASNLQAQRLRAELAEVRRLMDKGRLAVAGKRLDELAQRWPRQGEVWLLSGRCEEALGRTDRALAAWSRVPNSDPHFTRAIESRASLLINLGQFAPAESLLLEALAAAPKEDRFPLLHVMARLLRLEGRNADVSEVLTAAWLGAPEPSDVLQDLWYSETDPVPVDGWKVFLDAADQNDDRVWLGKARHALLIGQFDIARKGLERCLERRPEDPVIWLAWLDLAIAAEDPARFWDVAHRIPAELVDPLTSQSWRSWIAARSGDRRAETKEWTRLLELQPSSALALERLAVLAIEAGKRAEAERFQKRKAEIDHARNRIHGLVVTGAEFRPHAEELAQLSGVLGRTFDQNAWTLVVSASAAPRSSDEKRRLEQALKICRGYSEAALARFLAKTLRLKTSAGVTIADRLGDLRSIGVNGKGPLVTSAASEPGTRARLHFVDDAETAGLRFVFDSGRTSDWLLPETLSGGVGLVDFDGDGWLDVYCVQGGSSMAASPTSPTDGDPPPGDRLFRNQRDGTFRDVTRQSGIERLTWGRGYGQGIAVGDYDHDGHPDLFITRLFHYDLLRNRGDGTFEDVTERAGLAGARENPTSSAFADLDNDGDLDLYVCHYVRWDPHNIPVCKSERDGRFYCDPAKYERALDHIFRNDRGRFVDMSETAGFTDADGRGLGVVAADVDDDNRIDLFVANDGTANFLFRNKGSFQFTDEGLTAGVAGSAQGGYQAGMGVVAADLDGDGRPDLLVTNLYLEGTTLYQNLGAGMFADRSAASGILASTRYLLGFGIAAIDAGNDGRLDVVITNGNVNDFRPLYPFKMPTRLYEGRPGGRLVDVSDQAGPPWSVLRLGRGLATGDLDNDGRPDFVIMVQNEPLAYFHNQTERAGHFVTFRLEGTQSNRDGVGARVVVTTDQGRQVAQRTGGGSYLSAADGRLHFGLGSSNTVQSVEVRWPSGHVDRWINLTGDTGYLLREGHPGIEPLPGFPPRAGAADPNSAPVLRK